MVRTETPMIDEELATERGDGMIICLGVYFVILIATCTVIALSFDQ